jgi:hypothetical protein
MHNVLVHLLYFSVSPGFCIRFLSSESESRIRVGLRLAVYSQSVRLGAKPFETHGQNNFLN